jgi:type II secretory ATPase GspE/PulE/Tfp pilus assembly ATPase PilB-like protein
LRQDPDVILVGEIRDRETLDVSIEAALTGHLVLSTLHTNSAVSTITRLLEMELEPYLLASTLVGIVTQRLVRRICNGCRKTVPAPPETRHFFPPPGPTELHRGAGCRECRGTGYRRRSGIYEMLRMTEKIRELILQRASEDTLAAANRANGLASLRDDGIAHVLDGTTTLDEVLRVAQEKQ